MTNKRTDAGACADYTLESTGPAYPDFGYWLVTARDRTHATAWRGAWTHDGRDRQACRGWMIEVVLAGYSISVWFNDESGAGFASLVAWRDHVARQDQEQQQ